MTRPLRQLLAEHRRLESLLLEHQVHLVERRPGAAADGWRGFAGALRGHIRAEDEVVLPAYAARVTARRGGEAEIFSREHRRLERFTAEVAAWLAAWGDRPWPATEIIALLEREKTLKEILEHHDQRETDHLYAALERELTGAETEELLARFRAAESRGAAAPPGASDAAGAALLAAAWLAPLYRELMEGETRPRAAAPWDEAASRLDAAAERLRGTADAAARLPLLEEMAGLLDDLTPMNRFPARRATRVHACWQLLHAALRATRAAAGARA